MMKNLRGRNLKHPGCLIGVTLGAVVGIIIAGVMAAKFNVPLNIVLWTWLAIILFLAALGWIIGSRLSSRFPAEETGELVARDAPLTSSSEAVSEPSPTANEIDVKRP